jgi:chaperonin GroES
MSSPLQPLAKYVVTTPEVAKNKTASGLYIPDSAADKPEIVKVVAVGPDAKSVKVNDRVIYGGYDTTKVKVDKQEYILIKEEDIRAVVK